MEELRNKVIVNKGIFNNIDVMENSLESFNEAFQNDYIVRSKIQYLKDGNFILFSDNSLEKLFNLKDSLKNIVYDELDYISKFKIMKLTDLLDILDNNLIILEINFKKKKCLKKLAKRLENFSNKVIIESSNICVLKFFKKYNFKCSLLIKRKNKRMINSYFKPDIYNIEIGLFDNKIIKKLREGYYVIGHIIRDKNELKKEKCNYENVVIEF